MPTYSIHIAGQVQGIGFRPFVFRLATHLKLKGSVSNQADGVHIQVQGEEKTVQEFIASLSAQAPLLARIQSIQSNRTTDEAFEGFQVLTETSRTAAKLKLTPDLALCALCRGEIKASDNRRFMYAFTTCTSCGPRYSIMTQLPYEREHTTMAPYIMCETCEREYHDPENRHYYSQTNSCPQCPVTLTLYDVQRNFVTADRQEVIFESVKLLQEGRIMAVKGIGGYLLMADATNEQAIVNLRKRKHRPSKPFALMYPDLETAHKDVFLNEEEQTLLLGPESPIVLAQKKDCPDSGIQALRIAPQLNKLGLMLPYTPLFELLLSQLKKPVVATSANSSGNHIIFRDEEAFEHLAGIADFMLVHNREILTSQDDSVLQLSPRHRQQIMLRRSRGYAPSLAGDLGNYKSKHPLLALGADMKSTFAFTSSGNTCVSQYLGDLSFYDNILNFEHSLEHLTSLFDFHPSLLLTDQHPGYVSAQFGKKLAQRLSIPYVEVQHHEAHFAAVLAENKLLESQEPVLGVIWDGAGLGNDGLIRGGEFLLFDHGSISQLAQLHPYPHMLGNKMAQEPRIAALALCQGLEGADQFLRPAFTAAEWELYQKLLQTEQYTWQTTSMGRVFDAAAALIGLCTRNNYEGEAAMLLEAKASQEPELFDLPGYAIGDFDDRNVLTKGIFRQMIADLQQGTSPERIAAQFHVTLVKIIKRVANQFSFCQITFSGGVFQNSLLVDLIIEKLSPAFQLHFHQQLPPNDACISFGQLSWLILKERQREQAEQGILQKQHADHHTLNP